MKIQYWKTSVLLILGLWFASCYEDKGNYDYSALNRVTITLPAKAITVARGEILDIVPTLALNGDTLGDNGRYEYAWNLMPKTTDGQEWVLGESKCLYYRMQVPVGDYILVYSVKDKETGLNWKTDAGLSVKSEINEGWLLMTEVDENGVAVADLDICAKSNADGTYSVVKNMLSNSGFPYRKGPRSVCLRGTNRGVEMTGSGTKIKSIYVLTDQATGWLDYQTLAWKNDQLIRYQMIEQVGDDYTLEKVVCLDLTKVFAFTSDKGVMTYNFLSGGLVFGDPINFLMENNKRIEFEVAPFLGGLMADGLAFLFPNLLYDQTHQQFVKCEFNPYASNSAACYRIPDAWGKPTGMDMRYMQSCGKGGAVYALLQQEEGKYQQYKFTITSGIVAESPYAVEAPHLTATSFVAYQQEYGFLYYSSGRDLYTYRRDNGEIKVQTMNAEITALGCVHVPYSSPVDKYIAVATYDDTKKADQGGRLTILTTEAGHPETVKTMDVFSGLGKVKSIDYLY